MKIIILFCVLSLALLSENRAFSQQAQTSSGISKTPDYEGQVRMVYGDDWMAINPEAVTALEFYLSNRITYVEEQLTPNDKYPLLSSFPLMNKNNASITEINYSAFDPESFLPLTYSLPVFTDMTQVIRVDGTNYIIVIEPIHRN